MTNLTKFSKGMLLAASLTFASLSANANANTTPEISQVNTALISSLQQAFSAQVHAMADEMNREIDIAIDQGLIELGLGSNTSDTANSEQKLNNDEEQ